MSRVLYIALSAALMTTCGLWEDDKPRVFTDSCAHLPAGEWVSLGLENEVVTALASDPRDPGILYAGTGFHPEIGTAGRLLKSTDCGAIWNDLFKFPGTIQSILIDPTNPNTVFVAAGYNISRTRDGGKTWLHASNGLDNPDLSPKFWSIGINPRTPTHVLAGSVGMGRGRVYESRNRGVDWEWFGLRYSYLTGLTGEFGPIVIHPNRPRIAVLNGYVAAMFMSTDDGQYWERVNIPWDSGLMDFAFHPLADCILFGADLGKGLTRSADCGPTWDRISITGLPSRHNAHRVIPLIDRRQLFVHYQVGIRQEIGICDLDLMVGCDTYPMPMVSDHIVWVRSTLASTASDVYVFGMSYGITIRRL